MEISLNKFVRKILFKTADNQFLNAVKITLCAGSSFAFLYNSHLATFAFSVALGVMLCSTVDIDSSFKDKIKGIGLAMVIIPFVSILFTFLYNYTAFFYACFFLFVFFSSLISIYGQRANKFSFALLLGMCLSFINITNTQDVFHNAFFMFIGGLYYMIISIIFYFLFPNRYINLEIANCSSLISQYLNLKAQVWIKDADIEDLRSKRLILQISINDSFQNINQYLETNKMLTINSNHNRKIVLTVSFLHEIINLASNISFKDTSIAKNMYQEHILKYFHDITNNFSFILADISTDIKSNLKYTSRYSLSDQLDELNEKASFFDAKYPEDKAYLDNAMDYVSKQVEKISALESVYQDAIQLNDYDTSFNLNKNSIFKSNNYQLKTLIDNLNFKSVSFKYALRFAIAMFVGLIIGNLINLEKVYWVLLTILVIMRPGYGLTKARAHSRIIGTVIGGFLGVFILFFIKDTYVLSILAIIVMVFSYWLISSDYKIGVTFLTLFIILIFGILKNQPNISYVYRIADTLIGALVALLATHYLWPSWEINSIKSNLKLAITSSMEYFNELKEFYFKPIGADNDLILARKNAFITSSNLMSSYQRLVQEPKSKQQNRAEYHELSVLNQTLIGAISSLKTFLAVYKFPKDNLFLDHLTKDISTTLQISLDDFSSSETSKTKTNTLSYNKQNKDLNTNKIIAKDGKILMIKNQLVWIHSISEQIEKVAEKLK